MAKRPGVYLFEAGSHEDILANDGKLAVDDFLTARRVLNSFSSLSFASDCSFFPVHYEEDLVQEERRKNFVLKDWAVAALVSDDSGKLLKALLVNLSHHDEGFLVDLRYGVILVAFYRGFDIREFPDVPVQFGTDFLSSIGIAEEEYAVSSEYSLDEDDEEAPIIEVEKPRFVANSKKKIVNFGGGEILTEEASDDEDEDIQIDVDRPSFQAGKKNKIRNLGSSYSVMDEEDDEEVNIDVARPSFQASSNKKPRNLNAKPDWKKKEKVIEVKEYIEVERPAFEAGKKRKIGAIIDTKPVKVAPKAKPIEKEEEKPVKISPVERVAFTPAKQGVPNKVITEETPIRPIRHEEPIQPVVEEKNWVFTDIFKLKPRVFQGERAILHDPKAKGDEKFFVDATNQLSTVKAIRISKNCVFAPAVLEENDKHFDLLKNFDINEWDALALTINKDEQVLYVFLANKKEIDFCILVSFKHKGAHVVVISSKGGAIDDRALPYYSYNDLRAIVFNQHS